MKNTFNHFGGFRIRKILFLNSFGHAELSKIESATFMNIYLFGISLIGKIQCDKANLTVMNDICFY